MPIHLLLSMAAFQLQWQSWAVVKKPQGLQNQKYLLSGPLLKSLPILALNDKTSSFLTPMKLL